MKNWYPPISYWNDIISWCMFIINGPWTMRNSSIWSLLFLVWTFKINQCHPHLRGMVVKLIRSYISHLLVLMAASPLSPSPCIVRLSLSSFLFPYFQFLYVSFFSSFLLFLIEPPETLFWVSHGSLWIFSFPCMHSSFQLPMSLW